MTLKLGSTDIKNVAVGSTPAKAVYLGTTKVWPTGSPIVINGTTRISGAVPLPTHKPGDLIVVFAYVGAAGPSAPSAGGTVPSWTRLTTGSVWVYWTIATSSTHTSGTWTNLNDIVAVSISGHNPVSPFGGVASSSTSSNTAPAVTLENTSGSSALLHYYSIGATGTAGPVPAGYENIFDFYLEQRNLTLMVNRKLDTTVDGAVAQPVSGSITAARTASLEIKSA